MGTASLDGVGKDHFVCLFTSISEKDQKKYIFKNTQMAATKKAEAHCGLSSSFAHRAHHVVKDSSGYL